MKDSKKITKDKYQLSLVLFYNNLNRKSISIATVNKFTINIQKYYKDNISKKVLGHSTIEMTKRHSHKDKDELNQEIV